MPQSDSAGLAWPARNRNISPSNIGHFIQKYRIQSTEYYRHTTQDCVKLEISKSKYERFCTLSVAVPFCVFDDKDHNFTASFVI